MKTKTSLHKPTPINKVSQKPKPINKVSQKPKPINKVSQKPKPINKVSQKPTPKPAPKQQAVEKTVLKDISRPTSKLSPQELVAGRDELMRQRGYNNRKMTFEGMYADRLAKQTEMFGQPTYFARKKSISLDKDALEKHLAKANRDGLTLWKVLRTHRETVTPRVLNIARTLNENITFNMMSHGVIPVETDEEIEEKRKIALQ